MEQSTSPTVPVVTQSATNPATSWPIVIQCRENTPLVKQRRFGPKNKHFTKTRKERTTNRPTPYKPQRDSLEKGEKLLLRGLPTQQQIQGNNTGVHLQQPSPSSSQQQIQANNSGVHLQQPYASNVYPYGYFLPQTIVYPYGYYLPQTMAYPQLYPYNVNHNQ